MKVAINGLGRIGRAVFKILVANPDLEVAAINDVTPADNLAYLLNHDTVYGRYANRVTVRDHALVVADRSYAIFAEADPERLPWSRLNVDLVFECTGRFNRRSDLTKHLEAGAKRVILSAPAKDDDIPTVDAIRGLLAETRAHLAATLREIGDDRLGEIPAALAARKLTIADVLQLIAWHEAHHQGQAHITFNLYKAATTT